MNYQETLDFLYSQLPQYQKIGAKAYKADLDNITSLCRLLDHPESKFPSIHVAGTNGKGSVCNMLASIFQEAGYKTGLFTSPHIIDFRERIRINGTPIPQQKVITFVEDHGSEFTSIKPSFFEWSTALAFNHFAEEKVDIAIIETGLGGRLDSTNIISPLVSVITSIGLDHTVFLGDTLAAIAFEKGGIIKTKTPVVLGPQIVETKHVFENISKTLNAPIHQSKENKEISSSLVGNFQANNIGTCVEAINLLQVQFPCITETIIKRGLSKVQQNTGLRGRWETLQNSPKVIADIGHNDHAIAQTVQQFEKENFQKLHIVWGMAADKNIAEVVNLLPKDANYYLCAPEIPRAMSVDELIKHFVNFRSVNNYHSCKEAFIKAQNIAAKDDLIFIGGSTFVVAEIICDFFQ